MRVYVTLGVVLFVSLLAMKFIKREDTKTTLERLRGLRYE